MKLIILTKEQADDIRGRYGRYSALEPIELPDGMFMLPEDCLKDPDLKDAYKKMDDAIRANGKKVLAKLSETVEVQDGEYYIDDISLVPEKIEEATSNLIKCIKDSTEIDVNDSKIFLTMYPQAITTKIIK